MVSTWSTADVSKWLQSIGLDKFTNAFVENEMEGQDILDIDNCMLGQLITPIGKRMLFLREQAKLKNSATPSKPDAKPGAGTQSQEIQSASEETTSTPTSSTFEETQIKMSLTEDADEISADLWNDLNNYKLPPFVPYVKCLLTTRKSPQDYLPGTGNRRSVISALTRDLVKRHILILSKKGYTNVLKALFSEYPHIGDPKCWRMSLRTKMKSIRFSSTSSDLLTTLKHKYGNTQRKRVHAERADEENQPCQKRQKLEIKEPEDDQFTTQRHIKLLLTEFRKHAPNVEILQNKMERTFSYRWKKINEADTSVEDILSDFPVLRERNFLAGEAERHGIFKPRFSTYVKVQNSLVDLLKYAKMRCKNYRRLYSKYEEDLDSTLAEDQRNDCSLRLFLQLLPSLFKEKEDYLLVHSQEDIKSAAPVLVFQEDVYSVYINNMQTVKMVRFTNAIEAFFNSYWVFSLEYPKPIEKTMLFLAKFLFNQKCKVPAAVCTWAKKIGMSS